MKNKKEVRVWTKQIKVFCSSCNDKQEIFSAKNKTIIARPCSCWYFDNEDRIKKAAAEMVVDERIKKFLGAIETQVAFKVYDGISEAFKEFKRRTK